MVSFRSTCVLVWEPLYCFTSLQSAELMTDPCTWAQRAPSLKNRCCCEFCEWSLSARCWCLPACCLTHTGGIHQNNETLCGSVLTAALRYPSNMLQNIHRSRLLNHMLSLSLKRSRGWRCSLKKKCIKVALHPFTVKERLYNSAWFLLSFFVNALHCCFKYITDSSPTSDRAFFSFE